jgi:hypothetical protein
MLPQIDIIIIHFFQTIFFRYDPILLIKICIGSFNNKVLSEKLTAISVQKQLLLIERYTDLVTLVVLIHRYHPKFFTFRILGNFKKDRI